jgi:hypothetical protein
VSKPTTTPSSPSSASAVAQAASPDSPVKWEVGDVGFDTEKKLWFVQLFNEANQNVGTYMANAVILKRGNACQYEWKDSQGKAFWHVRERFFAEQIESIGIDPSGANLTVHFKAEEQDQGDHESAPAQEVPTEFHYLHYAFHLSNKEIAIGNKAPLGFVEFYDANGKLIHVINNRWILIEGVDRKSVGTYPNIRLRVERKDVGRILSTRSAVIIQSKSSE